jgi:transmembrane sensor
VGNFDDYTKLHPAISQQMLDEIEQHIEITVPKKISYFKIAGIAASLIAILSIAVLIGLNIYKNKLKTVAASINHKPTIQLYSDTVYNKADKTMLISLQDGSTILLSGKGEIVYKKPFIQRKREVYLTGEAIFKVAKDKTRPFTVYAGDVSTTALGTSFKVTAFKESKKTSVLLYNGKVVIKVKRNIHQNPDKDIFLTPGHMMAWDKMNQIAKVSSFTDSAASNETHTDNIKGVTTINNNIIQFKNQSLSEVIRVLQKNYHINIQADQNKLLNRYFTGTVNLQTDSPDDALQTIATLNKLKLSKRSGTYMLDK